MAGSKTSAKAVRSLIDNVPAVTQADIYRASNLARIKRHNVRRPAVTFLGKAPGKSAGWGAEFTSPFVFTSLEDKFTMSIPMDVPGCCFRCKYLVSIKRIELYVHEAPAFFVGCAQIKIIELSDRGSHRGICAGGEGCCKVKAQLA
ncbi:hypothetical protein BJ912DRAFT_1040016 [Pholiota molesta]|nr:hypothetical protein BJ912DRAFT_1040016 [Pholiota molesta]